MESGDTGHFSNNKKNWKRGKLDCYDAGKYKQRQKTLAKTIQGGNP